MVTTVDRFAGVRDGLGRKAPARVATTANITLAGLQTIDGVALADGDRVLVWQQTAQTENGVYNASSGNWTRTVDFNGNRDAVKGTAIYVTDGTANGSTEYELTTANPVVFGTSNITFISAYGDVLAAAEAAQAAAEAAAAAALGAVPVANRTALAALDTAFNRVAVIYDEAGRNGVFIWNSANLSASVTADPGQGVYVPPASATSGASGAWVRDHIARRYNVEWFGCSTSSSNNYQAVTNCITLAKAQSGGTILFPQAYETATEIIVDGNDINLLGMRRGGSGLYRTTAGRVIKFTGSRHGAENMIFYANVYTATTTDYIVWCENIVEFFMHRCWLQGGYHCLAITGGSCSDNVFSWNKITFAMGTAMVYIADATAGVNGSHYFYRNSFNQGWPVSVPNGNFKGARTNSTSYVVGDVYSLGSYYYQCGKAGTSGGSAPTTTGFWYGQIITDGSAEFYLAGHTNYSGVTVDTNVYYVALQHCDFTAPFQYCIRTRNSLAGDPPNDISIERCTLHGPVSIGVYIEAGTQILLTKNDIWSAVDNTATTYGVLNTGGYDVRMDGNGIYTMDVGAQMSTSHWQIHGGTIANCASGITVANSQSGWTISGVDLGASVQGGANTSPANIGTGCDYYTIVNNIIVGAGAAITNGSSGASNKTVTGNH